MPNRPVLALSLSLSLATLFVAHAAPAAAPAPGFDVCGAVAEGGGAVLRPGVRVLPDAGHEPSAETLRLL